MWIFGHEGRSSQFYLPQHPLVGDGVKVTACHPGLSLLWREAGCCLVRGPPAGAQQSTGHHWGPLSDNPTWAWPGAGTSGGILSGPEPKESGYMWSQTLLQVMGDFFPEATKKCDWNVRWCLETSSAGLRRGERPEERRLNLAAFPETHSSVRQPGEEQKSSSPFLSPIKRSLNKSSPAFL